MCIDVDNIENLGIFIDTPDRISDVEPYDLPI